MIKKYMGVSILIKKHLQFYRKRFAIYICTKISSSTKKNAESLSSACRCMNLGRYLHRAEIVAINKNQPITMGKQELRKVLHSSEKR